MPSTTRLYCVYCAKSQKNLSGKALKKIVIIGYGNVGWHLARELYRAGHNISQIFSRKKKTADTLAKTVHATVVNDWDSVDSDADFYLLAVSDDAIEEVSQNLKKNSGVVAHTSGTVASSALANHERFGVFYPLQTFTRYVELDWSVIPFCIWGNRSEVRESLMNLALTVNYRVSLISDEDRANLHVAAVFANNFSNHVFAIAEDICLSNGLDFSIIKPLISESVKKLTHSSPSQVQTGPAARGDKATMDKHLERLGSMPEYQAIYQILSKSIMKGVGKRGELGAEPNVPRKL